MRDTGQEVRTSYLLRIFVRLVGYCGLPFPTHRDREKVVIFTAEFRFHGHVLTDVAFGAMAQISTHNPPISKSSAVAEASCPPHVSFD
jgi:hypothetical protein